MIRKIFSLFILILALANFSQGQFSVKDDLGREVYFEKTPKRIVSLAPSITEILFFIGAGDKVVGVTRYCNYPEEAKKKQIVGGVIDPNYEVIASLKPDLIVMTVEGNTKESFNKISELGYKVFVLNPRNFDGVFKSILALGEICGVKKMAQHLVDSLKNELEKIKRRKVLKKPKVFVIISINPIITAGKNTFINEIIESAGGVNVAGNSKQNYPVFSREEVLKVNPDIIIVAGLHLNKDELLRIFPEWRTLNAVKMNRIFQIDPDIILRPSPRVVLATKIISKLIEGF